MKVSCWWCHQETDSPIYLEYPSHPQLHAQGKVIPLCPGCHRLWAKELEEEG